jgi:hypothetical protein
MVAITATQRNLRRPSFVLDYDAAVGAALIETQCAIRNIGTRVNQQFVDIETMCNEGGEAPGAAPEEFVVQWLWTYGATGIYNLLKTLEFQTVTFAYVYRADDPVGPENLEFSGSLIVPKIGIHDPTGPNQPIYQSSTFKIVGDVTTVDVPANVVTPHPGT